MLEEVIANWDRYGNTVASLQAWLEDAEKMLNQSEHAKKVRLLLKQETSTGEFGNRGLSQQTSLGSVMRLHTRHTNPDFALNAALSG